MLWILLCIQHGWSFADEPTIQLPQPADITEQDAKGPAEVVVGGPLPAGWRVQFWTMRGCGPCVVQKGVMQRGGLGSGCYDRRNK